MTINIKRQIVSDNVVSKRTYGEGNPVNSITIHMTGNTGKGADAQAHANLQSNLNSRQASWHYTVDDKEVIQSFEDNAQCWHATDGRGPGNLTSLAIEICVNSDGNYKKALDNAVKLVQHLLKKHNLTADKVYQHNHWYPKNCPAQLRAGKDGITWNDFIKMIKTEEKQVTIEVKPQATNIPSTYKIVAGDTFWGLSQKYNIPVATIQKLNPSVNPNRLQVGQVINLKEQQKTVVKPQPVKQKITLPSGVYKLSNKYNANVKIIQTYLNQLNFKCGTADGYYGAKTQDAVKRFQMVYDPYNVDGIYGARTKQKMEEQLNK